MATVNALVEKLRDEQGINAFVVLLHQGGSQRPPSPPAVPAATPTGDEYTDVEPVRELQRPGDGGDRAGLDDACGVIVSAHTHQPYICEMTGKLVTSAASFGRS